MYNTTFHCTIRLDYDSCSEYVCPPTLPSAHMQPCETHCPRQLHFSDPCPATAAATSSVPHTHTHTYTHTHISAQHTHVHTHTHAHTHTCIHTHAHIHICAHTHTYLQTHLHTCTTLVSRSQTLFRTKRKGLGFGRRATCRPAPWSAYQSQHSIQSHDT